MLSCKIVNGFGYQTYPRDNCGYGAGTDTWSVASGPHNIYVPSGDVSTLCVLQVVQRHQEFTLNF